MKFSLAFLSHIPGFFLFCVLLVIGATVDGAIVSPSSAPKQRLKSFKPFDQTKFKVYGDLRLRQDSQRREGTENRDRNRQRLRLRTGIDANVTPHIVAGVRVATGGASNNSANQDLGEGFSKKPFRVDLAYVRWALNSQMTLTGGKMKIPFYRPLKSELIWDSDVNPEGIILELTQSIGSFKNWSFKTGAFVLEERKEDDNAMIYTGQVSYQLKVSPSTFLHSGMSYYGFSSIKGREPLFGDETANGNSLVRTSLEESPFIYARDYQVLEAFSEVGFNIGATKCRFGFDSLFNSGSSTDNFGISLGFKAGDKRANIPMVLGYRWSYLEKDAVLGAITGSDSFAGGTDGKAHHLFGEYFLNQKASVALQLFVAQVDLENKQDYIRGMADFKLNF